jgi:hypothetical protein
MAHYAKVANSSDGVAQVPVVKGLWQLSWGLVFVLVMTVLAECGPRMGFSKSSNGPTQFASQPAVHSVK